MHLLIPFASSLSEACGHVVRDLALPRLADLLTVLTPTARDDGDEYSLSPPHERAIGAACGWQAADGAWPFAAQAAARDGIDVGGQAWGLVTPAHWHVARDHVSLADPDALQLDEAGSRALFAAVHELFDSEGLALTWGAPLRWYATHELLADLPCAALDRVIGRDVALWTRHDVARHPQARLVQRLQSEVQMLLYPHPINEAREAEGELTVNSFWLSGCGRHQPANTAAVQVDARLRAPMLAQDWAAWAEAWRAVDGEVLAGLSAQADRGEPVALTLCGERSAQRFESRPRSMWQKITSRWHAPAAHTVLEGL